MEKVSAVARVLLVLVAIASAFVDVPFGAALLVVLGIIGAIGYAGEAALVLMLTALVLSGFSGVLDAIPEIGGYLSTIFSGIGAAAVGGSIAVITIGFFNRIKSDWA